MYLFSFRINPEFNKERCANNVLSLLIARRIRGSRIKGEERDEKQVQFSPRLGSLSIEKRKECEGRWIMVNVAVWRWWVGLCSQKIR